MKFSLNNIKSSFIDGLRRLERYTHTDNVYAVKNGAELLLMSTSSLVSGVVIYLLYSRLIPQAVFGIYKYYITLFGLFALATFTGIDSALTRSAARNHDGSLAVAFKRKIIGGALGALGFVGLAVWYVVHQNPSFALGSLLIAVVAPWFYAANLYVAFLSGKRLFGELRRITLVINLISFIILATGILTIKDPLVLFAVYLASNLTNVAGYIIARRRVTNHSVDTELVSFGYHLSALDVVATIAAQCDGLLIFHFIGPVQLAVYSIANIPSDQIKGVLKNVTTLAFPKFAEQQASRSIKQLLRKAMVMAGMTAVCVGTYIVLAPFLFHLLLPSYLASIPYTQALSASLIFAMPSSLIVTYFYAQGRKKEITLFNLLNYGALIILDIVGIFLWGVWGIVFALFANRMLMFFFSVWQVIRLSKTIPASST